MKKTDWPGTVVVAIIVSALSISGSGPNVPETARAESASADAAVAKPVEDSMHEFMEYVFQPTYKRLKLSMAQEPADNATWKSILSDSLILAEGGNLLLLRRPKKNAASWNQISAMVRELGGEFYRSARAKNYKAARKNYEAMLLKCNTCHKEFDNGKHQLTP